MGERGVPDLYPKAEESGFRRGGKLLRPPDLVEEWRGNGMGEESAATAILFHAIARLFTRVLRSPPDHQEGARDLNQQNPWLRNPEFATTEAGGIASVGMIRWGRNDCHLGPT
jgi:hypothetical protein